MILQTKHKILLASLAYQPIRLVRNLFGLADKGRFKRGGFEWELDLSEVVDFMIYLTGGFETSLNRFIRKNLREGMVALDIGANIGAHSLGMAQAVGPKGKTYAVEATEYAYSKLTRNIVLNPCITPQIEPLHSMLIAGDAASGGDIPVEEIPASWPFKTKEERHHTHQGVYKKVGGAERISLDSLIHRLGINQLNLVKIDVDGNEHDVLHGGRLTFTQMKPVIVMEVALDYHETTDSRSFQNIHKLLTAYGYRLHKLNGRPLPDTIQGLQQVIPPGSSLNVLALPIDHRTS
ncbi:MAG TPA: FkbM family methyltransferase [Opitutales bacterium]|nr:FkbM family methyltransferase [Opitutales bacterium]